MGQIVIQLFYLGCYLLYVNCFPTLKSNRTFGKCVSLCPCILKCCLVRSLINTSNIFFKILNILKRYLKTFLNFEITQNVLGFLKPLRRETPTSRHTIANAVSIPCKHFLESGLFRLFCQIYSFLDVLWWA